MDLLKELEFGICERGNHAFSNEEGAAVLFAKLDDESYLQSSYTPGNYPAWDVSIVKATDKEMRDHIMNRLSGWFVEKCQFDINITDNCVEDMFSIVEDVVEHVEKMADKYDFQLDSDGIIFESIDNSAVHLDYVLSDDMRDAAIAMIYDRK